MMSGDSIGRLSTTSRAIGQTSLTPEATLVFCHAAGFVKEMWHPTVDELAVRLPADTAYDCMLLDFSGHGDSRQRASQLSHPLEWWKFCADDIMEALGPSASPSRQHTIGVGHSMGGAALVHTELAHPGTFDFLFLLEPILRPPENRSTKSSAAQLAENAAKRRDCWSSKHEAHASLVNRGIFKTFDSRVFDHYISNGLYDDGSACLLKCAPQFESELYARPGPTVWHRLGEIRCPVHVLVGGASKHMQGQGFSNTQQLYESLSVHFPKGEFWELEGLGHFASFEAPGRFADILYEALDADRINRSTMIVKSSL